MHPKIKDEYVKNKVPIPLNANDIDEEEFFQQTLPNTRKVAVNHIVRVVRGDKEFLLSDETMTGQTLEGNTRYLNRQHGKYPFPYFVKAYNPTTGRAEANGKIDRTEERYDIPSNPQVIKKLLAKDQVGTNTMMTVDLGAGLQFPVANKNDFINLPADKLVAKITGKDIESITGAPQPFVTRSDDNEDGERILTNSQQEQEEARRRMYDFSSLVVNSTSSFGPTEEQKAAAIPTLAPQPQLNVVPSTVTRAQQDPEKVEKLPTEKEEREQEIVEIEERAIGHKEGEGKKALGGQSKATNRVSENVGVVLKNEDTGVKQNMTKDSITIEEPQGPAAKKQREQDEKEAAAEQRRR
jgi:hypothetical protein